mmetsp:Transcript_56476/g.91415  ORF Transcript_56476/g.91415 Transcript_56476/m.91415 type:complete len:370 (+) Transcript_56476:180-1289(+)
MQRGAALLMRRLQVCLSFNKRFQHFDLPRSSRSHKRCELQLISSLLIGLERYQCFNHGHMPSHRRQKQRCPLVLIPRLFIGALRYKLLHNRQRVFLIHARAGGSAHHQRGVALFIGNVGVSLPVQELAAALDVGNRSSFVQRSAAGLIHVIRVGLALKERREHIIMPACCRYHERIKSIFILHVDVGFFVNQVLDNIQPAFARGLYERSPALFVHHRDVGTGFEQRFGGLLLRRGARDNKGRFAVITHGIDVCLSCQQHCNGLEVSPCCCHHQGRPTILALGLHIKTFFNELLQQVIPTLSRKFRQQIPSLGVSHVDICALFHELHHDIPLSRRGSVQKRCSSVVALDLQICAVGEEEFDEIDRATGCC